MIDIIFRVKGGMFFKKIYEWEENGIYFQILSKKKINQLTVFLNLYVYAGFLTFFI